MPRPKKIVKNEISLAIAELRRVLGHSQQSFAHLLGMSIGAVARWELNSRPHRTMLKHLIDLASENGHDELAEVFYSAYRREFGLAYDIRLASEACATLEFAITLLESLPKPRGFVERQSQQAAMEKLRALQTKLGKFPTDPKDVKIL